MAIKNYLYLCLICGILGILLFAFHKNIIIINNGQQIAVDQITKVTTKQKITFFYWNGHECVPETLILIMNSSPLENIEQIISHWAQLLLDEKIIKKKVSLQSVLMNGKQTELFVNFDRSPWNKESSTFEKWMIIESLLKTIKMNNATIKKVQFLVQHSPLADIHLDFNKPWPIEGFL